jgi:hypothetical protein
MQQAELFFDLLVLPDTLAHEVPLLQVAARVEGSDDTAIQLEVMSMYKCMQIKWDQVEVTLALRCGPTA